MIYRFGITTPANTAEANKEKTVLKLCRGIIHQVEVTFPPGCAGLLHVAINRGLYQVWPSNPDEDYASDGETISFREHYELWNEPFHLEVYAWNTSTKYPHSSIIRIGILPRKFILRRII